MLKTPADELSVRFGGKPGRYRRWLFRLALLFLSLLVGAVMYTFRPSVQRAFVLRNIAPMVDSLAVDYLRLTPWSLVARGLDVGFKGGRYHIGEFAVGFNPLALFVDTVAIRYLIVQHTELDLRGLAESPAATVPFPGLFPTLNHGYAVALAGVDAELDLRLKGDQKVMVHLSGGNLRPHLTGELGIALRVAAGKAIDVEAKGILKLSQLSQGRIRFLKAKLLSDFIPPGFTNAEHVELRLKVSPPPGLEGDAYRKRFRKLDDGSEVLLPNPESVSLDVRVGEKKLRRGRFTLNGFYRGEDGVLSAGYRLVGNEGLIAPYVASKTLPTLESEARGAVQIDTLRAAGLVSLESTLALGALDRVVGSGDGLPARLVLQARTSITFDPQHLNLGQFKLSLADAPVTPRFSMQLVAPVEVNLSSPLSILATPRPLANITVGPLPLTWLNGVVAGAQFGGELAGQYELRVDEHARFSLAGAGLTRLTGLRVVQQGQILAEQVDFSVQPSASWSTDYIRAGLRDFEIRTGAQLLTNITVKVARRLRKEGQGVWRYRAKGKIEIDPISKLPRIATLLANRALPNFMTLRFNSRIAQRTGEWDVEAFGLRVGVPSQAELLTLTGLRTLHLSDGPDGIRLQRSRGDLLELSSKGVELSWFNPFLSGINFRGKLASAVLTLSAPTEKILALNSGSSVKLTGISMLAQGKPQLRNLDVEAVPSVRYDGAKLELSLMNTKLRSGRRVLLRGDNDLTLNTTVSASPEFALSGGLTVDVNAVVAQPVIAAALSKDFSDLPVVADVVYGVKREGDIFSFTRADATLKVGPRATIQLRAAPGLTLRAQISPGENWAQHVVGAVALNIANLSSDVIGRFAPMENIHFAEINASLQLNSDGDVLVAESVSPLGVEDVRIDDGKRALLNPFTVRAFAKLRVEKQRILADLTKIGLLFSGQGDHAAVSGDVNVQIEPGKTVPLTSLDMSLHADLPQLLSQPAVMPGHKLTQGGLSLKVKIDAARHLAGVASLDRLAARVPLAIDNFELPLTGEMNADGHGFQFTAPLSGQGKSGLTNATLVGHYAPRPGQPDIMRLDIASAVFYLNDILASAKAISPDEARASPVAAGTSSSPKTNARLDEAPDSVAAWNVLPYGFEVALKIDKLFYSDYLLFTKLEGALEVGANKFALSGLKAHFHDSAFVFEGVTRFNGGVPEPYNLALAGKVTDFDLNEFCKALAPDKKARIEGLFGVNFTSTGKFPNFSQLRNRALFDLRMNSRRGLFRPLPPDSRLLIGASDVLGFLGEGLSYVPTGGFGAGAVARLVNYIERIDYDSIDIHLRRDESRDVKVEQFRMLSPTVALTMAGGIKYQPGRDLLDAPLELGGSLDMLGRGAAILYSMDLMGDLRNEQGYWRGPEFRIWGSVDAPQSNFEDIIARAGHGTLRGGITRPISGLIGNVKYRWLDDTSLKSVAEPSQSADAQPKAADGSQRR